MGIQRGGVAFFDSGIGGLTVLAACRKTLPNTDFYYYGDNRHAPYGNLSPKKIRHYVLRVFRRFERLKVSAVVVACNTVTALCVEELRRRYAFPIIGTEPAVYAAAKRGGVVWVLTTRATYESERFRALCRCAREKYPDAEITAYPCDGLAGAIERGVGGDGVDVAPYLPKGSPDVVVLGCTHYPLVKGEIEKFYGCVALDGNEGIAKRLKSVLNAPKNLPKNEKKSVEKTPKTRLDHSRPQRGLFSLQKPSIAPPIFLANKKILLRQNINKRSFFQKNKIEEGQETKGEGRIFFLGKEKKYNENTYKQMFG